MITIRGKALGKRKPLFEDFSVPPPPRDVGDGDGPLTLRTLITHVVKSEVQAFQKRQDARRLDRVLSLSEIERGEQKGKISPEGRDPKYPPAEVDVEAAIATALEAFLDGLYLVVIDEVEYTNLDAIVRLEPDSRVAFEDADASIAPAATILAHAQPEMRLVGLHHLSLLGLNETYPHIALAVDDPDLRIACYATAIAGQILHGRRRQVKVEPSQGEAEEPSHSQFLQSNMLSDPAEDAGGIFERLVRLFERLPAKPIATEPLVWPWMKFSASRSTAADALTLALEGRSPSALLPFLDEMSPDKREWTALQLGNQKRLDTPSRDALLRLVGDASPSVRERAVKMMNRVKISSSDLPAIEPLLSRKASDLRRGIINMILSLEDVVVTESAARLTASKTAPERMAGLELLSRMRETGRSPSKVLELATGYRHTRKTLDREEQSYLDKLLEAEVKTYTLEDALGLMDPTRRTPPSLPVDRRAKLVSPAAIELLKMFDSLVHEHREAKVKTKPLYGESQEMVLGAVPYFPHHFSPYEYQPRDRKPVLRPREDLPLQEVWFAAYERRPEAARDADGLELARSAISAVLCQEFSANLFKKHGGSQFEAIVKQLPTLRYLDHVQGLISWLVAHTHMAGAADFAVDSFETVIAGLPIDKLAPTFRDVLERISAATSPLTDVAKAAGEWTEAHEGHMFGLRRWIDEPVVAEITKTKWWLKTDASTTLKPVPDFPRQRMHWKHLVDAFEAGLANENDLYDDLLGVRQVCQRWQRPQACPAFRAGNARPARQTRAGARGRDQPQARRHPCARAVAPGAESSQGRRPRSLQGDAGVRPDQPPVWVDAPGVREAGRADCAGESGQNGGVSRPDSLAMGHGRTGHGRSRRGACHRRGEGCHGELGD